MHVCLMLPAGARDVSALVAAVIGQHSDVELSAVWCGSPEQRPPADRWRWIDLELPDRDEIGWGRSMMAAPPRAYEWARTAAAIESLPPGSPVVVLRAGDVLVNGPLDPFTEPGSMTVVPRIIDAVGADGLAPDRHDLQFAGSYSTAIASIPPGGEAACAVAEEMSACSGTDDVGSAFARAANRADAVVVADGTVLVVGWGEPTMPSVALDVTNVHLEIGRSVLFEGRPPRWPLSGGAAVLHVLESQRLQTFVGDEPIRLPGGIGVDGPMRALVVDALDRWRRGDGEMPPDPFTDTPAFVEWLTRPWPPWGPDIGRYWMAVHAARPDLQSAFAQPGGADADAYREWTAQRHRHEPDAPAIPPAERSLRPQWRDAGRAPGGINLIGYLGFDKSLGDVARRVLASLQAADVPVAALDYHRSGSPRTSEPPPVGHDLVYDTNLLIINADQQANVAADYGAILYPGRRTIAYWFWDVAHVPQAMMPAFDLVDEVWVASEFTAEALRAASDTPVATMSIPVPRPERSDASRDDLDLPSGRFVFLVTFDHLSVTERKNPIGAIDAFRRAFPDEAPDGPVLVVKSINAAQRPAHHDWVRQAAAGRDDIVVIDRHVSRADQMALVAESDCMVSLHRTEGLGLHLVEAMWFGKPTIATRYSGNLSFMDDANSALVDATLVPVTHGEGYFPAEAVWAEPDLEQAASWMQRIAADPEFARRLGDAGRATMEGQPTMEDTGRAIASRAAQVPIGTPEAGGRTARSTAEAVKRRVGWLARAGANERAALDDHAAALRDLQTAVADIAERVERIERSAPNGTAVDGSLAEVERRLAQVSDVVAAMTLDADPASN